MLGKELTDGLKEIEDKQINDLKIAGNRWKITSVLGNTATVFDGNQYGNTVLEPKGADLSFLCGNCGNYGPWWGNRCLTCGVMSDD